MANWAGCAVRREASVDSTNRAARRWAAQGAPHGAVVVALALLTPLICLRFITKGTIQQRLGVTE